MSVISTSNASDGPWFVDRHRVLLLLAGEHLHRRRSSSRSRGRPGTAPASSASNDAPRPHRDGLVTSTAVHQVDRAVVRRIDEHHDADLHRRRRRRRCPAGTSPCPVGAPRHTPVPTTTSALTKLDTRRQVVHHHHVGGVRRAVVRSPSIRYSSGSSGRSPSAASATLSTSSSATESTPVSV